MLKLTVLYLLTLTTQAFAPSKLTFAAVARTSLRDKVAPTTSSALFLSDTASDFLGDGESSADTQERIQALVDEHPVLLFMKGSKLFPQCGFSNNAVQILNSFGIDFHTVDVLADNSIREGVKVGPRMSVSGGLYANQGIKGQCSFSPHICVSTPRLPAFCIL